MTWPALSWLTPSLNPTCAKRRKPPTKAVPIGSGTVNMLVSAVLSTDRAELRAQSRGEAIERSS